MEYNGFDYNGGIWGELKYKVQNMAESQKEALRNSLKKSANELLKYAREEAPEDTGFLKKTSYVEDLGNQFDVVFSATAGDRADEMGDYEYGGDRDYNYAWIQHERTWYRHRKGKAKYLSDPFEAHKDEWMENATNAIRRATISSFRGGNTEAKKSWNTSRRGWRR